MMARTESDYQKEYYLRNRAELSRKRKERYRNDPEYRKKILEATRRRRKESVKVSARDIGRLFELPDGTMTRLFTSGRASEFSGISHAKFGRWLRTGKLPETPYSHKHIRYFTKDQAFAIRRILSNDVELKDLESEVRSAWDDLGIPKRKIRIKPS